ncbi:MAG: hypothetical protein JNJ54_02330 [Myxococcaceae bacterium]|nr:hypothetical protein [Myxococcaceae bacterium]
MRALAPIAVSLLLACPPPPPACRADTCAGCCSADDRCVDPTPAACGTAGSMCVACAMGQSCVMGACEAPVDAGPRQLEITAIERLGWDADGGTRPILGPTVTTAGIWVRGPMGALVFQPGLVGENGTIIVAQPPAGRVMAQLGADLFLVTAERTVLFERYVGGRPGAVTADASTPVSFAVQGLVAADAGHRVRVFFTQDREALGLEARAMPPLSTGTTTFSATVDWATVAPGRVALPEAAAGDEGWFLHLLERDLDAGLSERQLVAAGRFPAVTMTSGSPATLQQTLSPAPTDTIALDIDTSGPRSLATQFGSRPATGTQFLLALLALPGSTPGALSPLTTHVLRVPEAQPFPPSTQAGRPFPPGWQTLVDFRYQTSYGRRAPGGAAFTFFGGLRTVEPLDTFRARRWAVGLGPPRLVEVSGRRLEFDTSAIGQTPTIRWTAPTIGTPTAYRATWYPLSGTAPRVFWTSDTSLDMPPGVLDQNATWVLELAAVRTGDGRPGNAVPLAEATFISGVLTP